MIDMTPFELASYNSHRRWFIILLASLGWMIGLVLSFDIGSDYQASFSTGQASWYFLAWEVSEILLVAGVFAVFTARTSASLEVGWVIFVFLAVAPGSGLLAPEIAASGKFLKIGTPGCWSQFWLAWPFSIGTKYQSILMFA